MSLAHEAALNVEECMHEFTVALSWPLGSQAAAEILIEVK
jgi:hypothetical protein